MNLTPQLISLITGLAAILGATVAVCLGHIDAPTYIAVVGPLAGVGVGAGVLHVGTITGAQVANGKANGSS